MLKVSFGFVFLLFFSSQVLSESIEDLNSSNVAQIRKVRQIVNAFNGNPFLQSLNQPQQIPATRLGIVGGMRQANLGVPAAGTILRAANLAQRQEGLASQVATVGMSRATALPVVGSPFVASNPLGAGVSSSGLGFRSAVGTVGRARTPAVLPPAGSSLAATRQLGSVPSVNALRSTVGTLGRTRSALPAVAGVRVGSTRLGSQGVVSGAAVVQPNLIADGIMNPLNTGVVSPSIVQLPFQRSVSPILSAPGILRAGRSVPELDEEGKSPELINKLQTALKTQMPDHHRVKRQYFKPSIDGSMLSNDRSYLLKASNESKPSTTTVASLLDTTTKKPKITVAGLIHSLFQLFDRIKLVLKKALDEHESE